MQEGGEPASPHGNSVDCVPIDQRLKREMALAALIQKRESRKQPSQDSFPQVVDSSLVLREKLREEFQRSSEYAKLCRSLQEQVVALDTKLNEANGRERVMLELAEELARARARGHELSALLSEQSTELLSRIEVHPQLSSHGAEPSLIVAPSRDQEPILEIPPVPFFGKLVSSVTFVAVGFIVLVTVVALALGTLALTFKVASVVGGAGSSTYDMRRTVY